MRIAMLAGAALLAVPVVADAATYRLSYKGLADYQGTLEPRPVGPDGVSPRTSLNFSFLIEAPDGAYALDTGHSWYNYDEDAPPSIDTVTIERFEINGYSLENAPLSALTVLSSSVALNASISPNGSLTDASFVSSDQDNSTMFATEGSYRFEYYFNNTFYEGPGEFSLTDVTPSPVPLPATAPLLLAGLSALAWHRRRG